MCDSPRLVRTMPVALNGPGFRRAAALFRRVPVRALAFPFALPLALAAVALPAHAAHHAAAHAVQTHGAAHAVPAPTKHSSTHGKAAQVVARTAEPASKSRGRHAVVDVADNESASASRKGKAGKTVAQRASSRPMSRRERAQAEAAARDAQRAEALEALQQRAHRYATGAHAPARTHAVAKNTAKPEAAPDRETAAVERTPDRRTEDRVHAWYRVNHGAATQDQADTAADDTPAKPKEAARPVAVAANARPDLSTSARKATTADFARAAAVQRETLAVARDQQLHQTTADDDNADAESRIPSTAPTEREPAPFVHGSFGVDTSTGNEDDAVPANRAQRTPAPIVRQTPPAPAIALAPPQHIDLKHRGDGLNSAIVADNAKVAAGREIPVMAAADSSPRAVRALAAETAASPTPRLKLPAPPLAALHKDQPAIAAVQSAARRKDLDPAVVTGMADATFDDDNTPATARTAIALSKPVSPIPAQRTRAAVEDADLAGAPAVVMPVNLFDRQGHLISVPPMKGSHEILVHQNQMAQSDGLDRIQDDGDLLELRQHKLLVALPDEESTYPDDRLPANRRYARPWTVRFLRDMAKAHYTRFGTPLIVTSAARTVEFQRRLVRVNGNAAPPTGDVASPHLYGQAIDIAKGRMSVTEIMWMRAYLTPVENDGKIDVEEEFQQACFHLSVYRRYLGLPAPHQSPAQQLERPLLTAREAPAPAAVRPEKKHRRISAAMLATGIR